MFKKNLLTIGYLCCLSVFIGKTQSTSIILPLGHTEPVNAFAISPSGKYLASASGDGSIKLWNIASGLESQTYLGHNGNVHAIAFSKDGQYLISGGQDFLIKIWNIQSGKVVGNLFGHQHIVSDLVVTSDKIIISSSYNGTIKVWNFKTGTCLRTLKGHQNSINTIALANQEKWVISGGGNPLGMEDNTIRIWEIDTGKSIKILEGHTDNINDLAVSKDGQLLASCSDGHSVYIWNLATRELLDSVKHNKATTALSFAPDGLSLYRGSLSGLIGQYPLSPMEAPQYLLGHTDGIEKLQFSVDGQFLFSLGGEVIKMWETNTGKVLRTFEGRFKPNLTFAYSTDGKYIATAGLIDPKTLWDMRTGHQLPNFASEKHNISINRLSFSFDNQYLLTTRMDILANDFAINMWDIQKDTLAQSFIGHTTVVNDFKLSPDNNTLVSCSDNELRIWKVNSGQTLATIQGKQKDLQSVDLLNSKIATGARDKSLIIWNLNGELLHSFKGHKARIMVNRFSPTGKYILAGGGEIGKASHLNTELILWNIEEGKIERRFQGGHQKFINSMDFSKTGAHAVTGAFDGTVCIWDMTKNQPIITFKEHRQHVIDVQFTADDQYVISSSGDNTIKIYDLSQKKAILTLITLDNSEWGIISSDNYYSCSKDLAQKIGFKIKDQVYPFEQFDYLYNRPDLIADKMPLKDSLLIKALTRAVEKRNEKLGFPLAVAKEGFQLPTLDLLDDDVPITIENSTLNLKLKASDNEFPLKFLKIDVNDVPIYGKKGMPIFLQIKSFEKTINIPLSNGKNKIQVSVVNEKGYESLKRTINITYNNPQEELPSLFIVPIAVSTYKDASQNLDYPVIDMDSLVNTFQLKKEDYQKIYVFPLYNEQVTKENIAQLKDSLANTQINDKVILAYAGHGLPDKNFNYYLASYDVNFNQPTARGIPFEALENLLDGIPARQKLFLIDACHAGEIDKAYVQKVEQVNQAEGKTKFRMVGDSTITYTQIGLYNSFQLMHTLFVDTRRSTGATIIGSASGIERALEANEWNNGVFIYALQLGLKNREADGTLDGVIDGQISIAELNHYLSAKVPELTNGLQHPTSRLENISNDFKIW